MESKTKKKPVAKKAPAKRKKAPVAAKKPEAMSGLCVNCAPLGYTQVLAMLLVSVFSLVTILSIASYKIDQQSSQIDAQSQRIETLQSIN
ncbi:hypothetical protein HOI83_00500 [Candidatus Uhrbacteria bacterium]|jgi:hypothetical protein|nr:hypothetical protein [Candidatus Uhrbacteria bacterium]